MKCKDYDSVYVAIEECWEWMMSGECPPEALREAVLAWYEDLVIEAARERYPNATVLSVWNDYEVNGATGGRGSHPVNPCVYEDALSLPDAYWDDLPEKYRHDPATNDAFLAFVAWLARDKDEDEEDYESWVEEQEEQERIRMENEQLEDKQFERAINRDLGLPEGQQQLIDCVNRLRD